MMPVISIDQELCTGCQECTKVCPVSAIEGEPGEPQKINIDRCVMCGQCVQKCKAYLSVLEHGQEAYEKKKKERKLPQTVREPLFAAYNVCHLEELKSALENPELFTMVQAAPAVRVGIAEDFGMDLGTLAAGKMAAALRRLGFDKVYDTNFAADLTIMEEASELVHRVTDGGTLPMFTSCCPAWVTFLERNYPEFLGNLSSCKSPQQMGGAVFKSYGAQLEKLEGSKVFSASIMPCTCKEFECSRKEMKDSGWQDVDVVITTRELAYLLKEKGIDFEELPEEPFDMPLGEYTGAGAIFGATGGVMEAAIRTGYQMITGEEIPDVRVEVVRGTQGFRCAELKVGDLNLKVGVVTGLKNVIPVLSDIESGRLDIHFLEVMTCPEGCVSGGGQPKLLLDTKIWEAYAARRSALFEYDEELPVRKSHENPGVQQLYKEFLEKPNSSIAHHLLHTTYGD